MKSKLINLLMFTAGAAIGSAVTWRVARDHFAAIADEEIESMREYYANKLEEVYAKVEKDGEPDTDKSEGTDEDTHFKITRTRPGVLEYSKKLESLGYVDYSNGGRELVKSKEADDVERPYVIRPGEFDELDGYRTISLTYYADRVLTDEDGNIIEDVDDTVGLDSLETFGQYEDDSVYVRDDRKKIDYEILADPRDYAEVFESNPHLAEDE